MADSRAIAPQGSALPGASAASGAVARPAATTPLGRGRYPILERNVGADGARPLVYLDSAATSLVSEQVTDACAAFLRTSCANIHRGAHTLAEEATDAYEGAREQLARFFGVEDAVRLIFTHGATESLNIVALGWAACRLRPGDVVAVAEDNHHANIVPWQMLANRCGARIEWIPVSGAGLLDYGAWCRIAEAHPRLVALAHQSNVLGAPQPDGLRIAREAQGLGAMVALDGAQAAGHGPVSVDGLPCDFYSCSAHKMGGLTGIGALMLSERAAAEMGPVFGGGGMISRVERGGFEAAPLPAALEAGTPPIAAAVAWAAAAGELEEAGLAAIAAHTSHLAQRARRALAALPGVAVLGDAVPAPFSSLVSFAIEGMHPHDVSQALDDAGVMVRAGHHCAQPLHRALGARASLRASFAGYSTEEDVDALVDALSRALEDAR